jgi:transcriptional regulator with XRE-family HTH domain
VTTRTLAGVIGANLKRLREAEGLGQADLARVLLGAVGLEWTRDTVASIELGRRALSIDELLMVSHAFGLEVEGFFLGDEDFALPIADGTITGSKLDLDLVRIRALLHGGTALATSNAKVEQSARARAEWRQDFQDRPDFEQWRRGVILSHSTVEEIAVERFAATPRRVQNAATKLWGRSTHDEFVARVESRTPDDTPRRSFDVIRGHVTRELLRELGEVLTKKGGR